LGSIQLTGGTNQFYTGVNNTNLYMTLLDQNGSPITDASATIVTDNPQSSGVGWGNNGETETNNSPAGKTTFTLVHSNAGTHNYPFAYTPLTDGQHTIAVTALGSTQSMTITSNPSPTETLTVSGQSWTSSVAPGTIMTLDNLLTLNSGSYCQRSVPCDDGNPLAIFTFRVTSSNNFGSAQINSLIVNDTAIPSSVPPLTNLRLWQGNPLQGLGWLVSTAGSPVQTSDGYAYTFQNFNANTGQNGISVPNGQSTLYLTGDVPSDTTEVGSTHTFSIKNADSITANLSYNYGAQHTITVTNATGGTQTVTVPAQ
jgi:hypothetical protein